MYVVFSSGKRARIEPGTLGNRRLFIHLRRRMKTTTCFSSNFSPLNLHQQRDCSPSVWRFYFAIGPLADDDGGRDDDGDDDDDDIFVQKKLSSTFCLSVERFMCLVLRALHVLLLSSRTLARLHVQCFSSFAHSMWESTEFKTATEMPFRHRWLTHIRLLLSPIQIQTRCSTPMDSHAYDRSLGDIARAF